MVDPHRILISERRIHRRVAQLARAIDRHYAGRSLVVAGVLNGSFMFLADLLRKLKTPSEVEFLAASSYGSGTRSRGRVTFDRRRKFPVKGREVLLVDDILDTGLTLRALTGFLRRQEVSSLEICVLLRKRMRRTGAIRPRFIGFDVPDRFVFGYGLDLAGRFRNLPHIACHREKPSRRPA